MMHVEFPFEVNQKVKITDSGLIGKVHGMYIDRDKIIEIFVRWTDNTGALNTRYFRPEELEEVEAAEPAQV